MEMNPNRLTIKTGWMNAAGMLGFSPPMNWPLPQPPSAFVTNPISYQPRRPAQDRCIFPLPGGFLLHTGWPSPGFRAILRKYRAHWTRSQIPIWVHLLGDEPDQIEWMSRNLEDIEGVEAIELSFAQSAAAKEILDLIRSASGELPLVLCIPIDRIGEAWLRPALEMGVSAISLGSPRGVIFNDSGKPIHGRMYGPSILPLVLASLERVIQNGVPIIAGGGVMRQSEIDRLIQAGAAAVQLDFILWRGWQTSQAN